MIQFAVTQVFTTVPEAEFAIILEDDIQLSPDFMPSVLEALAMLETIIMSNIWNTVDIMMR